MIYDEDKYEEFAKSMEERFPKMFAGRYGGFAVGPGWWPILESLCTNIQSHVDWAEKRRAWEVEQGVKGEPGMPRTPHVPQVTVEQIKEKFGGLRFYYSGGNEYIHGLVVMAEAWADRSCEECGKPGERRSGGWIKTLCDEHEAERQARIKEHSINVD
jgi:hypothetical protein